MIGVDLVKISRISRLKERFGDDFLKRFLSDDEIKHVKNDTSIAGLWAAKEAASKALGVGIGTECGFKDIMISKTSKNAPMLKFSSHVMQDFNIKSTSISITHDGDFAIAVVALQTF